MCSASHLNQMDRHPSTIGAFLEGVVRCKPQPHIRSCIMKVRVCSLSLSLPLSLSLSLSLSPPPSVSLSHSPPPLLLFYLFPLTCSTLVRLTTSGTDLPSCLKREPTQKVNFPPKPGNLQLMMVPTLIKSSTHSNMYVPTAIDMYSVHVATA